jgi:hypothetical protein
VLLLTAFLQLYPQSVLCTERYALLTVSLAAALKDKTNLMVHIKDRFRLVREKFSDVYTMDVVELG